MVKVNKHLSVNHDGSVNIEAWLQAISSSDLVRSACILSRLAGEDRTTPQGKSCFLQSLEIAELVHSLNLGDEAIAAALVYLPTKYADLSLDDISDQLGSDVGALVKNTRRLQDIATIRQTHQHSSEQIDNIRKMLLAIVQDVRVVIIKLAERLCLMRVIAHLAQPEQQRIAQETMDIYAPLANRLGISELKWELEDHAFGILNPESYKAIAKGLQEKRIDRENRVQRILTQLNELLRKAKITAEIQGRAKHIYSIFRKMQRKKISVHEMYDVIAVRILLPSIDDCYTLLGMVHEEWQPIKEEFDDYISNPKPNGYRSIHTAVFDEDGKHFEIQMRTFDMHQESELGVAAHWIYKEGKTQAGYEEKIKWLRQLLDWQKELTTDKTLPSELEKNIFEDQVYVFTPQGAIIDLPQGSTPLDFAYTIHTDLGHRCRGAKIGGKIVPLTTPLSMGDTVEILTTKIGSPSRDWLLTQRGYLKTSRARAKVLNWFKKQDHDQHVSAGRDLIDREIKRLNVDEPNLEKLAHQLKYKNTESMLAALGQSELKITQITQILQQELPATSQKEEATIKAKSLPRKDQGDVQISGVGNLMTYIAQCCKPIPKDPIVGYITQGHGVSIHHQDCNNLTQLDEEHRNRLIEVEWLNETVSYYAIDIEIKAYDRSGLLSDIAQILSHEKISITKVATDTDKKQQIAYLHLTIEVNQIDILSKLFDRFIQLPNVIDVTRKKTGT